MADELPLEDDIKTSTAKDDKAYALAVRIMAGEAIEKYVYCLEEDQFYYYKSGLWIGLCEVEILAQLSRNFPIVNKRSIPIRRQIIQNMKLLRYKHLDKLNWSSLLNFENYMLNPYKMEAEDHNDIWYSTIRIPYIYDAKATCPLWLKSIDEILEGHQEKIAMMQEFFGYCLIPDVKHKKSMFFIGDSDSGKSTILNILREMVGAKNCSSVALRNLSNPQFTPMMVNKLVNIDPDVDKHAANYEGDFKIITSGEPVNCNQKFINTFTFIPYARIVLAANDFPKITDYSSAFYTRLLIIRCDRIFKEDEKNRLLFEQLKPELPGILNWAMAGLKRLNARGQFEEKKFNTEAVEELTDENNPSNAFFKEHVQIKFGSEIRKDDLYNKYRQWSEGKKAYTLSDIKFSKALFGKYSKQTGKDCRSSDTGRPRVWRNIEYVPFKSDEQITAWED